MNDTTENTIAWNQVRMVGQAESREEMALWLSEIADKGDILRGALVLYAAHEFLKEFCPKTSVESITTLRTAVDRILEEGFITQDEGDAFYSLGKNMIYSDIAKKKKSRTF